MAEVGLSPVALADFDEVLDHLVVVAGNRIAADYAEKLQAAANRLAAFPGLGTPRTHLGPDTRVVSVDPYLIFYDGGPHSETVNVLRILHGRRNITPEQIACGREP